MFFTEEEYLLADSGYTTTPTVIASFKKPAALKKENELFNHFLSKMRMKVEHCNGMIKGRFQCLRGLRNMVRHKKDHRRVVYWIRACAVLHNFLIDDGYDMEWNETIAHFESPKSLVLTENTPSDDNQAGTKKREAVKRSVLQWHEKNILSRLSTL